MTVLLSLTLHAYTYVPSENEASQFCHGTSFHEAHSFSPRSHLKYPSYLCYVTLDYRVGCLTFLSRSTSRVRSLSFDLIAVSSYKVKFNFEFFEHD